MRLTKRKEEDFGFIEDLLANSAIQSAMFDNVQDRLQAVDAFAERVQSQIETLEAALRAGGFELSAATRRLLALARKIRSEEDELKRYALRQELHVVESFRETADIIEQRMAVLRGRNLSPADEEKQLATCYRLLVLDDLTLERWRGSHADLEPEINYCLARSADLRAAIDSRFPRLQAKVRSEMSGI